MTPLVRGVTAQLIFSLLVFGVSESSDALHTVRLVVHFWATASAEASTSF
jgi:hypothetical protein